MGHRSLCSVDPLVEKVLANKVDVLHEYDAPLSSKFILTVTESCNCRVSDCIQDGRR